VRGGLPLSAPVAGRHRVSWLLSVVASGVSVRKGCLDGAGALNILVPTVEPTELDAQPATADDLLDAEDGAR
jgi:hypothetical protein